MYSDALFLASSFLWRLAAAVDRLSPTAALTVDRWATELEDYADERRG